MRFKEFLSEAEKDLSIDDFILEPHRDGGILIKLTDTRSHYQQNVFSTLIGSLNMFSKSKLVAYGTVTFNVPQLKLKVGDRRNDLADYRGHFDEIVVDFRPNFLSQLSDDDEINAEVSRAQNRDYSKLGSMVKEVLNKAIEQENYQNHIHDEWFDDNPDKK